MTLDAAAIRQLQHDLRTPLAVIIGFADVLIHKQDVTDEQRREYAQRITAAAHELRDLIDAAEA
jgi:signal transduction histidine kinase